MTIGDILRNSDFPQKPILEKLVSHTTGLSKTQLFIQIDQDLTPDQEEFIKNGYHAYTAEKQPLEYILGYVEFAGHQFSITGATLIPRPETEYMIEAVREFCATTNQQQALLDIGTGCGVLGLSVLIHCPSKIKQAYLTDLSEEALEVARKNYETYKSTITTHPHIIPSDLLKNSEIENVLTKEDDILLVANLPYIPDQMFDENVDEGVKKREPKMAFVGGDDGVDLYRIMFDQLLQAQKKRTHQGEVTMFLEMMTWQVDILRKEYDEHFLFEEVKTFHFNIRIVKTTWKQKTN